MLQDSNHVYHCHMTGVTCFTLDGSIVYHVILNGDDMNQSRSSKKARKVSAKSDAALSAVLVDEHLCVGTETAIYRIEKETGRVDAVFDKGLYSYLCIANPSLKYQCQDILLIKPTEVSLN